MVDPPKDGWWKHYGIIGESPLLVRAMHDLWLAARSNSTILITGASGTGKELAARAVFGESKALNKCYMAMNFAEFSESLIESELFGHVKGAFTGAASDRVGFLEAAQDGTAFIDEVGDLPMSVQVKLMRFIQERTITRVGSTKLIKLNVRIVAATHRNLREMVENGTFREDLFFRLNVIPIHLPDLGERRDDVGLIARHLLEKWREEAGRSEVQFDDEALSLLTRQPWRGNIRELQNIVERIAVLNPDPATLGVAEVRAALARDRHRVVAAPSANALLDQVLACIDTHNGEATLKDMVKVVGRSRETARRRLRELAAQGHVREVHRGRNVVFKRPEVSTPTSPGATTTAGLPHDDAGAVVAPTSPPHREAWQELGSRGEGFSRQELCKATGISASTAKRRLRGLVRSGALVTNGKGTRALRYFVPKGHS